MYLCMNGPHRFNTGGRAAWVLQAVYLNGALEVSLLGWMKNRTPCLRGQTNSVLACSAGVHQFTTPSRSQTRLGQKERAFN